MAKDYAKIKTQRPVQRRSSKSNTREKRLWLLACVMTGIFIIGLVYLKNASVHLASNHNTPVVTAVTAKTANNEPAQPHFDFYSVLPGNANTTPSKDQATASNNSDQQEPSHATSQTTDEAAAATAEPTAVEPAVSPAPSVPVENNAATVVDKKAEVAALAKQQLDGESSQGASAAPASTYSLQLALFKDFDTADEFKANLVLQGMEVKMQTFRKSGTTFYRILMGPYTTLALAKKQQATLKQNQIRSEVISSPH